MKSSKYCNNKDMNNFENEKQIEIIETCKFKDEYFKTRKNSSKINFANLFLNLNMTFQAWP